MPTRKKILKTPIRISLALLLLGLLAKVLQWPFGSKIMLVSFAALGILYLVRFWNKSKKEFIDYVKLVLVIFWTTNGVLKILHFPYTLVFQIIVGISFLVWFIMEGTAYFLDEDRKAKNSMGQIVWNLAMVLGTLAIICGSLLKILNWEYAVPLFALGVALVAAYILKDILPKKPLQTEDTSNEEFQL